MTDPTQPSGAAAPPASSGAPAQAGAASDGAASFDPAQEIAELRQQISETERKLQSAKDREIKQLRRTYDRQLQEVQEVNRQWVEWAAGQGHQVYQEPARQGPDPDLIREATLFKSARELAKELEVPFDAFDIEAADDERDLMKQARDWLKLEHQKAQAFPAQAPEPGRTPADRVGTVQPRSAPAPQKEVTELDVHAAIERGDLAEADKLYRQLVEESVPILEKLDRQQKTMGRRLG